MKKIALAAAAASLMFAGAASAADMAPRYTKAPPIVEAAFNWSGFYIGAHVGADWRRDSWNFLMDPGTHIGVPANLAVVSAAGTGSLNRTSFIGGGQIGYNWQAAGSKWVVGVEADASWVDSHTRTAAGVLTTGDTFLITEQNRSNWLATFRGRVGYTWDRSLLYVTGGLAVADIRLNSTYADTLNATVGAGSRSGVRAGFAVGAGWEQAFAPNWSVKVEYLYTQFERVGFDYVATSVLGGTNAIHVSDRFEDNIVRVGLNYRFGGGPVVARY